MEHQTGVLTPVESIAHDRYVEPSRVRGGALFGGAGGPLENYVGEVTKYVLRKADCRVILTAPAAEPRRGAPR